LANDFVQLNITIVSEKLVAPCWEVVDLDVCLHGRPRLLIDCGSISLVKWSRRYFCKYSC